MTTKNLILCAIICLIIGVKSQKLNQDSEGYIFDLPPLNVRPLQIRVKPSTSQLYLVRNGEEGLQNQFIPIDQFDANSVNNVIPNQNLAQFQYQLFSNAVKPKQQYPPLIQRQVVQQLLPQSSWQGILSQQNLLEHSLPKQNLLQQNLGRKTIPKQNLLEHTLPQQTLLQQNLGQQALAEQNLAQQNLAQQNLAQQNLAQQTLAEQNLAQQNLAQQALAEQNLAQNTLVQQNLAQQNLAQQALTEQNLAQQALAEQNLAQNTLVQQNLAQQNLAQQALAEQNLAQQALAEQNLAQNALVQQNLAQQNLAQQTLAQHNIAQQALEQQNLAQQILAQQNLAQQTLAKQTSLLKPLTQNIPQNLLQPIPMPQTSSQALAQALRQAFTKPVLTPLQPQTIAQALGQPLTEAQVLPQTPTQVQTPLAVPNVPTQSSVTYSDVPTIHTVLKDLSHYLPYELPSPMVLFRSTAQPKAVNTQTIAQAQQQAVAQQAAVHANNANTRFLPAITLPAVNLPAQDIPVQTISVELPPQSLPTQNIAAQQLANQQLVRQQLAQQQAVQQITAQRQAAQQQVAEQQAAQHQAAQQQAVQQQAAQQQAVQQQVAQQQAVQQLAAQLPTPPTEIVAVQEVPPPPQPLSVTTEATNLLEPNHAKLALPPTPQPLEFLQQQQLLGPDLQENAAQNQVFGAQAVQDLSTGQIYFYQTFADAPLTGVTQNTLASASLPTFQPLTPLPPPEPTPIPSPIKPIMTQIKRMTYGSLIPAPAEEVPVKTLDEQKDLLVNSTLTESPLRFGYQFNDGLGNQQSRKEEIATNGVVTGNYNFFDANGLNRQVQYIADHNGFRAGIATNEPGTSGLSPAGVNMNSKLTFNQPKLSANTLLPQTTEKRKIVGKATFTQTFHGK